ncbi:MAG: LysM peptidoglycan-binding domain-containing protein [Desulfobacterales bacterium]
MKAHFSLNGKAPFLKTFTIFLIIIAAPFLITGCASVSGWTDKTFPFGKSDTESEASAEKKKDKGAEQSEKKDEEEDGGKKVEYLPIMPLEEAKEDAKEKAEEEAEQQDSEESRRIRIQSRFDKSLEFYQASQDYWQQGELENALEALDNAYALIVNTKTVDAPKFSQQKDDLRFMISKRILEIYSSRYTTVKGNHNAIPISDNEYVEKEILRFTDGPAKKFFINSYRRSGMYRPYIVEKLEEAGLPEELSWLPLVESGFKTNALSSARALGMWQFIASTGHKYGLERDRYIDERLDPFKSTEAAIQYLKELHEIFGDWKTVLAAYNCGAGRVLNVIRTQNINYLDDFWDLYQQLPMETASYVPKFMAALHIINNKEKYGLDEIEPEPKLKFETVEVDKQLALKNIAEAMDIEEDKMTLLNPELRYKMLPEENYNLRIPPASKETLLAKLDDIEEQYQSPHNILYHRAKKGESLSKIASKYNTTAKKIAWYNNISMEDYIIAGQLLKIPQAGTFASRGSSPEKERVIDYEVKRGDSLWVLAKRYNTTTKKIKELNNLDSVNLHIGQKLEVPASKTEGRSAYSVKKGDSPYTIARRHNMNLERLLIINELDKNSRIYPGQTLHLE